MTLKKLEDIVPRKGYAFTVNTKEQYFSEPDRLKKVIRIIKTKLSSPNFSYKLYIELSPKGRIHGHGYIWIENPYEFVLNDISKIESYMNIDIDDITDEEIWYDYCTKQLHITKTWISRFLSVQSEEKIQTLITEYY